MDDFRAGSVAVNGKFLGEITRADGSKEHLSLVYIRSWI